MASFVQRQHNTILQYVMKNFCSPRGAHRPALDSSRRSASLACHDRVGLPPRICTMLHIPPSVAPGCPRPQGGSDGGHRPIQISSFDRFANPDDLQQIRMGIAVEFAMIAHLRRGPCQNRHSAMRLSCNLSPLVFQFHSVT